MSLVFFYEIDYLEFYLEKNLIKIGYIAKAHGLKGEVLLKLFDSEDVYIKKGLSLDLGGKEYVIGGLRRPKEGVLLKFSGVDSRNDSELLKGLEVSVETSVFEEGLEDGEVYLNQLLGFKVYLVSELEDELKGEISGFSKTEAHDLLRVELVSGGEIEIPYVDKFLTEISKLERFVKVDCPKELFDLEFLTEANK